MKRVIAFEFTAVESSEQQLYKELKEPVQCPWYKNEAMQKDVSLKIRQFSNFAKSNTDNESIKFIVTDTSEDTHMCDIAVRIVSYVNGVPDNYDFEPHSPSSKVLTAPGQPRAVNITCNSIKLTWKEPKPCDETVEHYRVSCFCLDDDDDDDDSDDDEKPQCKPFETKNDENTIVIPGLIQDTNYQFSVKAQYKTGLSKNSKKSTVIKTQPLAGPPGKPSVVNTTSNSVDLTWEKPQENPDNMDGYKVLYRSKHDPPNSEWKSQPTNGVVEQITISGLVPENLYYFKVQAVYNNVEGETSIVSEANTRRILSNPGDGQHKVDVSTHQATQLSARTSKALPAPGQPKVVNKTHNSIELTWKEPKPSGENVERYIVSCFNLDDNDDNDDDDEDSEDEPKCTLFETKNDEKAIVVPGLFQDTNYQFNVKAQYKTGLSKNSKKSAVIKTERLLLVSAGQPRAVNITHNSIELTWKEPKPCGENIECYIVSCFCLDNDDENDDDTVKRKPLEIMSNENTIVIPGLVHDTNYKFNVKAQYKTGFSNTSRKSEAIKTQSLVLLAPGQPKAVNITHNSIELTWKKPKPCGLTIERYIVSCFCLDNDDNDDDDDDEDGDDDELQCQSFETKRDENTFLIPGFINDTNYQFSVKAQYKTGLSKNSKKSTVIKTHPQVLVAGPPGKPSIVNATSTSIDLAWEKPQENPDNMDGYKVLYHSKDDTPNSEWKSQQTNGVVEHIAISGLVPEKPYYFKVQAMYNQVEGEPSTVSEAYTNSTLSKLGDVESPHQATHISTSISKALPVPGPPRVVNITHNSIELTWKEPKPCSEKVERYIVSCFCLDDDDDDDDDDESQCQSFETKSDEKAIVIPGLIQDTNYQFIVKAQYKTGLSKKSKKSAVIKTQQLLAVAGPPGKPSVVNKTSNSVTLSWEKPQENPQNVDRYKVLYHSKDEPWKTQPTDGAVEQITIDGLFPKKTYYFKVQAIYNQVEGETSTVSEAVHTKHTLPSPGKPTAAHKTQNSVELHWSEPSKGLFKSYDKLKCYQVLYRSLHDSHDTWESRVIEGTRTNTAIHGLSPATEYIFKVQAGSSDHHFGKDSKESDVIMTNHIIPGCPGKPRSLKIGDSYVQLQWTKPVENVEHVEYYVVFYCSLDERTRKWKKYDNSASEEITVTGLTPDTRYSFKVQANSKSVSGKESVTSDVIQTLVPIPSKPGQPEAVSVTHNSVNLKWAKPAQYVRFVMNYNVRYSSQTEQSKEWLSLNVSGVKENVTITGLSPKTTYLFKVEAQSKTGSSEMSEVSMPVLTLPPLPSTPGQPRAVDISQKKIKITWDKPQENAEQVWSYTIYYKSLKRNSKIQHISTTNDEWTTVKTEDAVEEFVVSGLEVDTSYTFKVQAESVDGCSKESRISKAVQTLVPIPGKPGQPEAVSITYDRVELKWAKPTRYPEYVANYHVSYSSQQEQSKEWRSFTVNGVEDNFTVTGLLPKTTYLFKVQGANKSGSSEISEVSEPICTLPPVPSKPGQPQAVNITHNTITITWAKPQEYAEQIRNYTVDYAKATDKHESKTVKTERADEVLVVSGLEPSTDYVFKVRAESVDGASEVSQTSNVIKTRCPVPSQPGKPKCKNKAHDRITLCWPKPNEYYENVECYKISYSDNKKEKTKVTDGRVEEIEIDGLDPQKGYYFKVKAKSKFGDSLNSLSSDLIGTNPVRPVLKIIPHCKKLQDSPTVYHFSMTQVTDTDVQEYAKFEYGKATDGTKNKVLMIVGATGSGKSTLINGMVNYLLGVEWDDEFRLKLIHEKVETQTKSVTKLISAYTFHKQNDFQLPYSLTIVDTPGFGDTEGIEKDQKITRQIKQFFTEHIDHLDGIGFVAQSGQARLTKTQIYIFDSIFSIFGKDMKDSIFTMVTFADSANPPVIGAIKEAEIPCTEHFQFNNSALYAVKSGMFAKMFWDMGATSFNEFFNKFGKSKSVSLKLTREVLDQREQLETNIVGLQQLIRAGMSLIDSLKQQQQILKQNESKIKANEDFEFEVEEDKITKIDLNPKEYVTNCLICNFTCHFPCFIPNDGEKYYCAAMKFPRNGNTTCTVCPGKCAWDEHRNMGFRMECVKTKVPKCYEDIKKKYYKAVDGKTDVEVVITNMETKIQHHFQGMLQNIQKVHHCVKRLHEIAFKRHPWSDVGYIDLLIESEIQEGKPDYQKRVHYYREVRKQAELISKTQQLPQQLSPEEEKEWWKEFLSMNSNDSDELVAALPRVKF